MISESCSEAEVTPVLCTLRSDFPFRHSSRSFWITGISFRWGVGVVPDVQGRFPELRMACGNVPGAPFLYGEHAPRRGDDVLSGFLLDQAWIDAAQGTWVELQFGFFPKR